MPFSFECVRAPVFQQCWLEGSEIQRDRWGGGWVGVQSAKFSSLPFVIKNWRGRFCQWWWNEMKSAKLKSTRSVKALERYGMLFSSINLPIFHVCEELFIDLAMIKWLSAVPQREPSSFSLFRSLSLLFLFHLLFSFLFPSLCGFSPFIPSLLSFIILFLISIHITLSIITLCSLTVSDLEGRVLKHFFPSQIRIRQRDLHKRWLLWCCTGMSDSLDKEGWSSICKVFIHVKLNHDWKVSISREQGEEEDIRRGKPACKVSLSGSGALLRING